MNETDTAATTLEGDDQKLIQEAVARFKLADEAESDIRKLALEDLEFRAGNQWPDKIKAERESDGRPCLVINRIPQFIQQVTNDQRQNRPSIKVHPVDSHGDVETAKVIQGLVRHIEYNSNADVAYDTAFESAVIGGRGFFRILTEYASPTSFEQEILIKRIRNPFSVFFDPYSQEPDGSDANFAFVIEDLSPEEFKTRYPQSKLAANTDWESTGNDAPSWISADGCRVAEYFYKQTEIKEIALLSNGQTVLAETLSQGLEAGVSVIRTRKAPVPTVKWCKLNGIEILEQTDWIGMWIPIVPVYGAELDVNGKRILEGIVRNAKDPARMYNYWSSAETEAIALAPRTPFIVAEGQIEGYENEWATANKRNHSTLTYKPTSLNGQPVGAPQRNSFEPAVQAITQARMIAADDIKATTGIYDSAMGARSNETSGVAIQRRNVQAQTSNFHFIDNLTRSLRHTGRILVDIIPKVYDTPRAARIIGDDGQQKIVTINQPTEEKGKQVLYQLDAGKYDVTIDVGPSFATKRQEAVTSMLEVVRSYPQLAQIAGDILVKNMDWPGAQEFADRIKKTLPPGLADEDKEKKQEIPPQVQAQMQQMNQMVEQLTKQLHDAHDTIDMKRVEIESRERIEMAKLETTATIELAKLESKEALTTLSHQIAELDARTKLLGFGQPIETDEPEQELPPQSAGAMGAEPMMGEDPTGGMSPGTPMDGEIQ